MTNPGSTEGREGQAVAESAGFTFDLPASTLAIVGSYTPCAPALSGFGRFELYAAYCIQEALTRRPHIDALYARYGDPLTTLVNGICEARDPQLVGLKAASLSSLIGDILETSQRDPDKFRALDFACTLHLYVGRAFRNVGSENRKADDHRAAARAFNRAAHHFDVAQAFTDAMRKMNEQRPAEAAE